jgi:hypothetical protein
LLAPRPTPILEDQASVFISPRDRVVTHFSRLLRHAWVTVGLFLFPGHHTGNILTLQHGSWSRHSSAVWRWATGWMISGSRGWEFFSSPPCPDRLWGPPSLLSNGYQRLFLRG